MINGWPNWLRWLLFLPAAFLAISAMHLALTFVFSSYRQEPTTLLGIGIEGAGVRWLDMLYRQGLMRFLEPWAFVAAGGTVAPARKVPAWLLACAMMVVLGGTLWIQMSHGARADRIVAAIVGMTGAVAGALTVVHEKRGNQKSRRG